MVYRKQQSADLIKAHKHLYGLQSWHPVMNMGNGLNLQDYF